MSRRQDEELPEAPPWPAPGEPWSEDDLEGIVGDIAHVDYVGSHAETKRRKKTGEPRFAEFILALLKKQSSRDSPAVAAWISTMQPYDPRDAFKPYPRFSPGQLHEIASWLRANGLADRVAGTHPWRYLRADGKRLGWVLLAGKENVGMYSPLTQHYPAYPGLTYANGYPSLKDADEYGAVFDSFRDLYAAVTSGALPPGKYVAWLVELYPTGRVKRTVNYSYEGLDGRPQAYVREFKVK